MGKIDFPIVSCSSDLKSDFSHISCSRCGKQQSGIRRAYCLCVCKSMWKKNDYNAVLSYRVDEPKLWQIKLCDSCIAKCHMEQIGFLIKRHSTKILTSIILIPSGIGVFLASWFFVTKILGIQDSMQSPLIGIIFGGIYIVSLLTSLISLILLPVNIVKLQKAKLEKAAPKDADSSNALFKAVSAEGRRIIDIKNGKLNEAVFGEYCLPIVDYDKIPNDIKKLIINQRTSIDYEIVKPSLTKEDLFNHISKEFKKKLESTVTE